MTLGSRGSDSAAQAGDARPERGPEEPPPVQPPQPLQEPREGAAGPAGPARPSGGPPGRRRAKPVLITACGVVPCPVPREVQRVRLHRDPQKQEVEVRSRWPFSYASQGDDAYRVHVKQVMLVASLRMQCADLNVLSTDPVTGLQMKPEDVAHKSEELGKKEEAMVQGVSLVPMKDLRGRVGLGTAVQKTLQPLGHHEKFLCEKVSKNMHITKTRYFNISGGRMRLYSYNLRLAKARTVFELKDVQKCVVEWVDQQKNNARPPGLKDLHPFHKGFQVRVRVELRERPHGPLYLYAANSARALSWQRVILLAKYLILPEIATALRSVVGKAAGSMLAKGWSAMVCYARWARQVKASVHRVSRKLVLGNLSRGFTKLLLVRRQRANQELEKAKAQEYAVQFLHQVLKGSQGKSGRARPAKSIRHEMISRVQHGFREFRERRILERRYPLSTSGNSRLSQLVSGSTIPCAFVSLSSAAALGAVLGPWTWRKLGLEEAAAQAATPAARSAYSAVNVPLSELAVRISANFSTLSFQHVDSRASHAQLKGETGWANFVQLDQVSSVVLRSERVMSYASPGSRHGQLHPATCEGVWLTLHGPRVGWCLPRQAAPAGPPAAARSDGPAGGPDGGALGRLLAESRHGEVAWLSVTLRLVGAAVPPPEGPAGGPEAREGVAEERAADEDILAREGSSQEALELDEGAAARPAASAGRRVCMVAHVLGRRFECEVPAAGLSLAAPEQPVEFKAEVPFVGLEALGCFDDCPVAVDIVQRDPGAHRTVLAARVPLAALAAPAPAAAGEQASTRGGAVEEVEPPSLARLLANSREPAPVRRTLPLAPPADEAGRLLRTVDASVDLEVAVRVLARPEGHAARPGPSISPELQGCGPISALYSSHRGLWCDPSVVVAVSDLSGDAVHGNGTYSRKFAGGTWPYFEKADGDFSAFIYRLGKDRWCLGPTLHSGDEADVWAAAASDAAHPPEAGWRAPGSGGQVRVSVALETETSLVKPFASKAANFIELSLKELVLPEAAEGDVLEEYVVEARCSGTATRTPVLHRPRAAWARVAALDPCRVDFRGAVLLLPLPPGAWCAWRLRPQVQLAVLRRTHREGEISSSSYSELADGRAGAPPPSAFEPVFRATVLLDGMVLEQRVRDATVLLSATGDELSVARPGAGEGENEEAAAELREDPAVLAMDLMCCDRDYARLRAAKLSEESSAMGQGAVLCVGGRAVVCAEEPLQRPRDELEWRRRLLPGAFSAPGPSDGGDPWSAPLREPWLNHEYVASGLDKLSPAPPFVARRIPAHADTADAVPHRYVLPPSEVEFLQQGRPGVFWRVMDDLASQPPAQKAEGAAPARVVERLSHVVRRVPCTVLAVYADGTCDLELEPSFLQQWQRQPQRRLALPGRAGVRAAGAAGPEGPAARVLLRGVPLEHVQAVQSAGFSVYDASLGTVDDALEAPRNRNRETLKLRMAGQGASSGENQTCSAAAGLCPSTGPCGGYCVPAGPVPADAGPAALYEWSLHLNAKSEEDMYRFVAALQQCQQTQLFEQLRRWDVYKASHQKTNRSYASGDVLSVNTGHLEVVLVEARHLRPYQVQKDRDLAAKVKRLAQVELTVSAVFRIMKGNEAMAFRGSTQQAAPMPNTGSDPKWSQMEEVQSSCGWVFKTPNIDPSHGQMKDVVVELDLVHKNKVTLGQLKLPAVRMNLCSSQQPFHNFWLPLQTPGAAVDSVQVHGAPQVHLVTMWVPSRRAPGTRAPTTVRGWLARDLDRMLQTSVPVEPISGLQALCPGYNPNVWGGEDADRVGVAECLRRRMDAMAEAARYLESADREAAFVWDSFYGRLKAGSKKEAPAALPLEQAAAREASAQESSDEGLPVGRAASAASSASLPAGRAAPGGGLALRRGGGGHGTASGSEGGGRSAGGSPPASERGAAEPAPLPRVPEARVPPPGAEVMVKEDCVTDGGAGLVLRRGQTGIVSSSEETWWVARSGMEKPGGPGLHYRMGASAHAKEDGHYLRWGHGVQGTLIADDKFLEVRTVAKHSGEVTVRYLPTDLNESTSLIPQECIKLRLHDRTEGGNETAPKEVTVSVEQVKVKNTPPQGPGLGAMCAEWVRKADIAAIYDLDEMVRRGVPQEERRYVWLDLLDAAHLSDASGEALPFPQGRGQTYRQRKLVVNVVSATNLRNADASMSGGNRSDAYCACSYDDKRIFRTHTMDDNLNPSWEFSRAFQFDELRAGSTLHFEVFDEDPSPGNADDSLGSATLRLRDEHFEGAIVRETLRIGDYKGSPSLLEVKLSTRLMSGRETHRWLLDGAPLRTAVGLYGQALARLREDHGAEADPQLMEDTTLAAALQSGRSPALLGRHLYTLCRVRDVCVVLRRLAPGAGAGGAGGAALQHSEGLLQVVFYLLLAFGSRVERGEEEQEVAEEEDEARAVALLCALAFSPSSHYRAYFVSPPQPGAGGPEADAAAADVARLDAVLAAREPQLWLHLAALGFHLSSVFYGLFLRLFASALPTTTLFRFWDILFSAAARPQAQPGEPPPRHCLIDLALGALHASRGSLLRCSSASEARDCITGYLASLLDPADMVALIADAERDVWAGPLGVVSPPVHAMTFDRTRLLWAQYFRQFEKQDAAVRGFLASLKSLATSGSSSPSQGAAQGTPGQQPAVAATILGFLRELHQRCLEQQGPAAHAGMLRRTPEKLCEELGPREGPGLVGQAWSLAARAAEEYFRTAQGQQEHLRRCTSTPDWVRTPPRCRGEPQALTRAVWEECMRQAVQKHKGAFDGGVVLALFEAFHHPRDLEISLNEVCAAVVCASSATVAEKAEALFGLYGTAQSVNDMFHVVPMSVSSAAVIEGLEGNRRLAAVDTDARQQFPAPANDDDIAGMALHFRLYGSNRRGRDTDSLLGHVFVPSLHDFSWSGVGIDRPRTFPIWGERVPIPVGTTQFISSGRSGSSARPLVGEAKMAIKWMPSDPDGSCVGQIGIHLFSVSFTARELSAQEKNPSLRVVTHDEAGGEVKIERWDPRKGLTRVAGTLKDMALTNVYGGHIEFSPTMWWDTLGALHTYHDGRGDQGWREAERSWVWSRKMGDQYSVQGMRLPEKFVLPEERRASKEGRSCASSDPNVISLQACRLLTQTILLRGYHCVTNRQAALISDMTFSRAGAVPGLLDAVLVPGEIGGHSDFEQARQDGRCTDVKYSMIYTHELQVTVAAGSLSLFPPRDGGSLTLQHLNIQDPYPGSAKVLWIRFARAGDGRRATVQIPVSPVGYLTLPPPDEIDVDMPERAVVQASGGGKPLDTAATQMSVTKSEFVNCVLASPLLSETLRRMTMADDSPDSDAPSATPTRAGVAVNLHVTIDDPDQDQEQQEFMDALELRQGILLEVWDSDGLSSRSDLLGECWLPQLSRFGPEPQVLDLMLEKPPDVTDATSTRPDPHKQLDESIVVKGSLKVEVTWKFPLAEPEQPDGAGANLSREELAKRRALMHSGTCTLKILEARRLRSADVGTFNRPGKSDPYVCVYVRNEAFGADEQDLKRGFGKGGWHVSDTRPHQWKPLMQTKVVKDNNNPVWKDEEKTFDLQTGGFERRTKRTRTLTHPVTKRGRQLKQDQEHLSAVGKSSENDLDVYFESSISQRDEADEDDDEDRGRRHGFRVFRGDTIFSFKDKLREACMAESDHEERHSFRTRYESAAKSISAQHVVMVFVPPDNLRSLKQRRQELNYKRQLQLELQDPSNWQPLDDLKTFGQYATSFGFGPEGEHQRLMVREGSEDLKNKNLRYRQFAEQRRRLVEPVGTTDTEAECFGYALCFHERDGGSREWRQALIRRPEQPGAPPRASLLCPLEGGASAAAPPQGAAGAELVLPAPAEPRIFDFSVPGHAEFLALAPALQAQGKSEREILEELNKAQREKWMRAKSQAGPGAGRARPRATGQEPGREPGQAPGPEPDGPQRKQPPRPVDITAREVRAALRRGGLG